MRKLTRTAIATIVAAAVLVPAGAAHGVISGTAGAVTKIPPPASVDRFTGLDSDTVTWAWDEQQGVTLATPIRVDIVSPGLYDDLTDLTIASIPAGTKVDSHFFDSVPVKGHGGFTITSTLSFPTDILGVIVLNPRLSTSNVLGSPGTNYTTMSPTNDLDIDPLKDIVNVTSPRSLTITAQRHTGDDIDEVRIITEHDTAPTADAGGPYSGAEGSPVALHGTASDGENDPLQYSWSFTPTGGPGTACTSTGATTLNPTLTCNDDAVVSASLTVNDPFNPPQVSSTTVTIGNVAPSLGALSAPSQVGAGTPVNLTANFTDAGTNDSHVASINWGDASSGAATINEANGAGSLSASHSYAGTGLFTITATLTDDNGGTSVQTTQIAVNGAATSNAGGPYSGTEGTAIGLVGTASDPENDPLTFAWTFTQIGGDAGTTCTPTGADTLAPTVKCNDDALVKAELSSSDGLNPPTISSTTVTVNNVAPVLGTLSGPSGAIKVGTNANVSASFTDISTHDTHTASVTWGDLNSTSATINEINGSGSLTAGHAYSQPGLYTVTVTLTDDNGGIDTATVEVFVNAAPTVSTGGPYVGLEGTQMSLSADANDSDGDALTYAWAFAPTGDPGIVCTPTGANTLTPSLTCNDDGTVQATLTVSDGLNTVVKSTTITVGNQAPVGGAVVPSVTLVPTNSTLSVTQTFTDAATNDTHTATIDWGDGPALAGAVTETAGSGSVTGNHQYSTAGTYVITVTITDDNGDSSVGTTTVVVNNSPTADAGGPYTGTEGSVVNLGGHANDPDIADHLTTTWDISWTGDAGTGCLLTGAATLAPAVTCNDDASVTATLTVSDGVNPPVTDTANIGIGNAKPTVATLTLPAPPTPIGNPVNASTTFVDAGSNDTHTATINWGDGNTTAGSVSESNGVGTVTGSHNYASGGVRTVTITVTDDNAGQGSNSGSVTINGSPTVGAGGPYTGFEGTGITLAGTASDPDADGLTISWSKTILTADAATVCNFTGTTTLTPTLTCNDNASIKVTVSIDDTVNPPVTASATVTVANKAPVVNAVNASPTPVATGGTVNVNTSFTDPGTNDTHTASINWGDGNTTPGGVAETNGAGTVTGSHAYGTPGTYHVTVTVTDDNGGTATSSQDVYVDSAPVVHAGGPYTGVEGANVTLGANATDPDGGAPTISWTKSIVTADPGTTCTFTGTTTLTPTLKCNDDGLVNVTITASDGINPPVSATTTVTLQNAAPSVATPSLTPNPAATGGTVSVTDAFTDQGTNDSHTASINWGDGNTTTGSVTEVVGSGTGTVTGSHAYANPGPYTVTVTVNDKDGGVSSASASIVVNAPPTVSAGGPYSGLEGSPVTLSGTATDADGDVLGTSWGITFTGDPGTTCALTGGNTLTPSVNCTDDATVTAKLTVTDSLNAPVVKTATVNIGNRAPIVTGLTVPSSPVPVGISFSISASFSDAGSNDTHTATINWGDATTSSGSVVESLGTGTVTATHVYAASGNYTVTATVTDDDGGTGARSDVVTVYVSNTTEGYVSGAGTFTSPSQAYTPANTSDTNYVGTTKYNFLASTQPNGTLAGGTRFTLSTANLNFVSNGADSLTISEASTKGIYLSTGTVNGVAGYTALVSVIDGGTSNADRVRVRIKQNSTGVVLYDNQYGAADTASATQLVATGSMVVHDH